MRPILLYSVLVGLPGQYIAVYVHVMKALLSLAADNNNKYVCKGYYDHLLEDYKCGVAIFSSMVVDS